MMRTNVMTVGMDMGNYSIKTSEEVIFRSIVEEYSYKNEIANDNAIIYNGKKYVIGKGNIDHTRLKSEKKNTLPLFLYGLYNSIGYERCDIKVIVGLPLAHHKDKNLIQDIKDMYSGNFNFKYVSDDVTYDIRYNVVDVLVFPEALGAFYSIDEPMEGRDVLLIDVGGGTINIALFVDGEYEDSITIQEGMNDIYTQIANEANFVNKGAVFSVEDILKGLDRGFIKWRGNIDNMDYVGKLKMSFSNMVLNQIKGSFPLYQSYEILLSGGGAYELKPQIEKCFEMGLINVVSNNIFANAIGFYKVGR